ncbi:hypothetical protein V5F53_11675 [Xanthobacter sp. V4C-4]|uniref:hypothetical protein n=1 Tax=Xanthobacter cornucopiae TaxID=3119924 RepID=UPI00372A9214
MNSPFGKSSFGKSPFGKHFGAALARHMRSAGPWPFITFRSYVLAGRHIIWRARQHRKGLDRTARAVEAEPVPCWQSETYNWITGLVFAIGSALFMLGAALSLIPREVWPPSAGIANAVFFAGSLPFTVAGYMQHFQAANAGAFSLAPTPAAPRAIAVIGWQPRSVGWLSTFTQFLGTLAFNLNTFDALHAPEGATAQDLLVWAPDLLGSLLFLVSGYLAFIETSRGYWSWKPKMLAWRIVFANLLGCIAFMTAAVLAYVPAGPEAGWIPVLANVHLFLGALGFLVGALLSMRESATAGQS